MKIAMSSDHRGVQLRATVKAAVEALGHEVVDLGPFSEEPADYPVYGEKAARAVANGEADRAIVICGSGIGISIAANKVRGVRAALCSEPLSAELCRRHNDANVLAMGALIVGESMALAITRTFLETEFEGGRHQHRIDMLAEIE